MYNQDVIEIGDTVIVCGLINPLLEYKEQAKQAIEGCPVDINWVPRKWSLERPDTSDTKVFINNGDCLTVISNDIEPARNCLYWLRKVQDKHGNQFYLSSIYFNKEPAQLSFNFKENYNA
jgi:hypothetical protein